MRIYTIYFELYGKKMKTDIPALDEEGAKRILEKKIIYHKITSKPHPLFKEVNDIFDYLKHKFKF